MRKKLLFLGFSIFLLVLFLVFFCNKIVEETSKRYINSENDCRVGVVLGTSKYIKNNTLNLFYKLRMDKAIELYKSGRIELIIVSGDNSNKEYDEPTEMKNDLIKVGIPKNKIYCDYAGFSTYDSMVRMKKVFQQKEIIIISQKFHIERAVYIARRNGIKAYAYPSKDVPGWYSPYNKYREFLARVKAVFEVVINREPVFLGDKFLVN